MKKRTTIFLFISLINFCQVMAQCYGGFIGSPIDVNDAIQYQIYYKNNAQSSGSLTKPLVIVEGFDPENSIGFNSIYGQVNDNGEILDLLRSDGYDIVVVNLKKNTQHIADNASSFQELIRSLKTTLDANSSLHQIRVTGISMGGLITRLALAQMEQNGEDHRTEQFISFDSPQQGANVPVGLQAMVRSASAPLPLPGVPDEINPLNYLENMVFDKLTEKVLGTAAQEMAMNWYEGNNGKRNDLLNAFSSAGNYPQKLRKVALSFGSSGVEDDFCHEGSTLFHWEGGPGTCVFHQDIGIPVIPPFVSVGSVCVEWCPIKLDLAAWAMPGNFLGLVANELVTTEPGPTLCDLPIGIPIDDDPTRRKSEWRKADNAPGSYYQYEEFQTFKDFIENAHVGIDLGFNISILGVDIPIHILQTGLGLEDVLGEVKFDTDKTCFVPVTSALDIKTDDLFYDVTGIPHYPYPHDKSITEFDAIQSLNTSGPRGGISLNGVAVHHGEHPFMPNGNMIDFMKEEVSPNNLFIQNRQFYNGYKNHFEVRGYIAVGKNVDLMPNRTLPGDVTVSSNSHIIFSPGYNQFTYFDDGFDAATLASNGVIEVIPNYLAFCNSSVNYTDLSNFNPQQNWKTLRTANPGLDSAPQKATESAKTVDFNGYPNPFQEESKLEYYLPESMPVTIIIRDQMGSVISTLMDNVTQEAGYYKLDFKGAQLPSGVYNATLIAGNNNHQTIRLVLNR